MNSPLELLDDEEDTAEELLDAELLSVDADEVLDSVLEVVLLVLDTVLAEELVGESTAEEDEDDGATPGSMMVVVLQLPNSPQRNCRSCRTGRTSLTDGVGVGASVRGSRAGS